MKLDYLHLGLGACAMLGTLIQAYSGLLSPHQFQLAVAIGGTVTAIAAYINAGLPVPGKTPPAS